jgi:hypothetical protein
MPVYKTKVFSRWDGKQELSDAALCRAVEEMKRGLFDADLGSGLFKKRIARPGQGKSGGYRTLLATNRGSRWVFVYGFAKNERSNIDKDEEQALKALAGYLIGLSESEVAKACKAGELTEVNCDA